MTHLIMQQWVQKFQATNTHTAPPAKGMLSLLVESMEEGDSFFSKFLDLGVFYYMLIPKSITIVRGKKYIYSKAMGTHPQKDEVNPTYIDLIAADMERWFPKGKLDAFGGRRER